jgi:hypothetical protein
MPRRRRPPQSTFQHIVITLTTVKIVAVIISSSTFWAHFALLSNAYDPYVTALHATFPGTVAQVGDNLTNLIEKLCVVTSCERMERLILP